MSTSDDLSRRSFLSLMGLATGVLAVRSNDCVSFCAAAGADAGRAEYGEFLVLSQEGITDSILELAVKRLYLSYRHVASVLWHEHRKLFEVPEPTLLAQKLSLFDPYGPHAPPYPALTLAWRNDARGAIPLEFDAALIASRAWLESQPRFEDIMHAAHVAMRQA